MFLFSVLQTDMQILKTLHMSSVSTYLDQYDLRDEACKWFTEVHDHLL